MKTTSFYSCLDGLNSKPDPFSVYTASELWNNEHTSRQMLGFHLNGEVDVSSRRINFIDESVSWMANRFNLSSNSKIIDFGCGPGLYTCRLAELGATVHGVDFSSRSIAYAREQAARDNIPVEYTEADYLDYQPAGTFDLVTMIMCDYCALAPVQRAMMLRKFGDILSSAGRIVLDVYSLSAYEAKQEVSIYERNQMNGFWSSEPYFGFLTSFKYDDEKVSLDKYTIIERNRHWQIHNWLQYFSLEALEHELNAAGLKLEEALADVAGRPYDANHTEFAVVVSKAFQG